MFSMLLIALPDFTNSGVWISLLTLTFLEIVLGVDNIIFVSIVANRLPQREQRKGRNIGLFFAMALRVALLFAISWILSLDQAVITIPFGAPEGGPIGLSIKDLILLGGGLFLLYKSTSEIHHKLEGKAEDGHSAKKQALTQVIFEIVLVNLVFSFDSILTAIGLTKDVVIMMIAIIASMGVMMLFAAPISNFINKHPTMQMLALSFLILIGMMLVAEAFHQHVSKGYIYFAIAFSLSVEILNLRLRKRGHQVVKLNTIHADETREGV